MALLFYLFHIETLAHIIHNPTYLQCYRILQKSVMLLSVAKFGSHRRP